VIVDDAAGPKPDRPDPTPSKDLPRLTPGQAAELHVELQRDEHWAPLPPLPEAAPSKKMAEPGGAAARGRDSAGGLADPAASSPPDALAEQWRKLRAALLCGVEAASQAAPPLPRGAEQPSGLTAAQADELTRLLIWAHRLELDRGARGRSARAHRRRAAAKPEQRFDELAQARAARTAVLPLPWGRGVFVEIGARGRPGHVNALCAYLVDEYLRHWGWRGERRARGVLACLRAADLTGAVAADPEKEVRRMAAAGYRYLVAAGCQPPPPHRAL